MISESTGTATAAAAVPPPQASPTTSSPPAKRVKTDTNTMATANPENNGEGSSTAVPKLDQSPPLLVKKLSDQARLPTRGSAFAAGYDLYAAKPTTIPARGKALVDTDIAIAVPAGTCAFLLSPSPSPTLSPTKSEVEPRAG